MDITFAKDLSLFINAVGAGNYLLLSYIYLQNKRKELKQANTILSLLFLALGIIILNTIFNLTEYRDIFYGLEPISNAFGFAIAPLLFLYVKSCQPTPQKVSIWSAHLIHFYTYLLITLSVITNPNTILGKLGIIIIENDFKHLLWNIHFLSYLILTIYEFRKVDRIKNQLARIIFFGITITWFINLLFFAYKELIHPIPSIIRLNISLLFSAMTFLLLYQKFNVKSRRKKDIAREEVPLEILSQKNQDFIYKIILENKYYRDPNLNIRSLSEELEMPYYELSIIVNQQYHKNFNEFINSFRIEEIVNALETKQHQSYTIMGLAQEVGFKSASAFYAAFKKEKGMTPTKYLQKTSSCSDL